MMKPGQFPLRNPPNPPEIECFGFKFDDIDIGFRRGYVEFTVGYKDVAEPSQPKVCDELY